MYRPKGFNAREIRQRQIRLDPQGFSADREINMIEAGADAMLEGLKKQSKEGDYSYFTGEFLLPSNFLDTKGYLVFIPEEKG